MKLHIARFANAERASWSNFGTSVYIVILPDLGFSPDGQVGVHVSKIPADHRECRRSLMVHEKEGRHFPRFGVVPPFMLGPLTPLSMFSNVSSPTSPESSLDEVFTSHFPE